MIFIHPSILDILFEMFNCEEIDGVNRLSRELDEECYTGTHLYLVLFLVVPSCILWGIGIPTYSLIRLIQKRKNLHELEIREELGYLYNGYLFHAFYWESVIMYRKVLMVIMATLLSLVGRKIQAMLVFALMVFIIALHNLVKPFMTASLNNIEMLSILALMCSIYAGIFFVTDISNNPTAIETRNEFSLTSFEKVILYLLFLISNLTFIIVWGVLFIVEARRFMRIKYPKLYHLLCLCNNEVAVKKEKKVRDDFFERWWTYWYLPWPKWWYS